MAHIMDGAAVAEIRRKMDKARTGKKARRRMAELAIERSILTDCGRAEWQKEL